MEDQVRLAEEPEVMEEGEAERDVVGTGVGVGVGVGVGEGVGEPE